MTGPGAGRAAQAAEPAAREATQPVYDRNAIPANGSGCLGQPRPTMPESAGPQPRQRLTHPRRRAADLLVLYRLLFKLVLQNIPPEAAHALASRLMRLVTSAPGVSSLLRRLLGPSDPALQVRALGTTFPSPVGVAAGMDKDATWFESLGVLGFGFVEVGTITDRPQDGNPRPRVWRLPAEGALLNSMGFPNPGANVAAARLRKRTGRTVVGINIGKSMAVPIDDAGADYARTAVKLAPLCDYVVLNVSSPNTPGLRSMQDVGVLERLVADVREALTGMQRRIPLLVKIAPDLTDAELDEIADLTVALKLDGIVAVNTTVERDDLLSADPVALAHAGGISGRPLQPRAIYVLKRLRARVADACVLVSVGGVASPDDAWQRLLAGATLVQTHTGFVYGGPAWPHRTNRGLLRRMRAAGFSSVQDAIGAGSPRRTASSALAEPDGDEGPGFTAELRCQSGPVRTHSSAVGSGYQEP
jgi:dihydroorotate dehydrogenase